MRYVLAVLLLASTAPGAHAGVDDVLLEDLQDPDGQLPPSCVRPQEVSVGEPCSAANCKPQGCPKTPRQQADAIVDATLEDVSEAPERVREEQTRVEQLADRYV